MKKAGCRMVAFGIESGSPEVLKEIGKGITIEEAKEAVRACRQAGIRTQCTFIVGFPSDTKDSMRMTLDAAMRIGPTIAIFFPLTPYPGTRVFSECMDPSLVPQHITEWAEMIVTSSKSAISVNRGFSGDEVRRIADRWNRRFFFRPTQLVRLLKSVSNMRDFLRLARGGIYLLASLRRH
ncbi:radical SAM protein, partial [Candidatus Bipolaricaulota bacterium]|nr:radical SAM protein [Candidatus Bipolaricaulota bacterium]